jgi:hypothetical protein
LIQQQHDNRIFEIDTLKADEEILNWLDCPVPTDIAELFNGFKSR